MLARIAVILAGSLLLAAASAPTTVSQSEIDAENARWTSLGVHLPPGGIVMRDPYSPPYSNRSFVVPFAWYERFYQAMRTRHDFPVSAAALREDLPTLRLLVEKTYAGYGPAKARGWDWNKWFDEWSTSLAARGTEQLSLREAFAPWGKLEDFQLDNHSGVPSFTAFMSGSVSAVLAKAPAGACTSLKMTDGRSTQLATADAGEQPHAVQEWSGTAFSPAWYVSYPKRDGDADSITCGGRADPVRLIPNDAALSQSPAYEPLGDGIAYVRLPTFTDANDEALRQALNKAQGVGRERLVLLDLRGNDGGNAPSDVLTNWVAESAIEQAGDLTQDGTQSCFRTALFFGLQQQLASGLKPPASAGLTQFLQQIADTLRGPSNCNVEPVLHQSQTALRDHHFTVVPEQQDQPRLVAIVDNGCGSDCEYMATIVAGMPDSVIAGSSTYGIMGFTQPGYFVLPHSGVPFRLALSRTDAYGDGRSVDGYGITADVLLATAKAQSRESLLALGHALLPPAAPKS